jgi:N-acetylmuramoyl-L-alanine amidase
MRRPLACLTLVLACGVFAPNALAQEAVRAVDLPSADGRSLAAATGDGTFTLVGVHWRGQGTVVFRTRSLEGRWSAWHRAAPEDEDGPNPMSSESRRRPGWRIGNPWWVGASDRIQTRRIGKVSHVRAYLVWSPAVEVPLRRPAATDTPAVVPRATWGASESIRRGPPSYAPRIRFAVVHHTAGKNAYTQAEAAAIVKGIQLYHVQGNGWNDIGYNFLVDRFGTIYEGRYGGVDKAVVGAHAKGFNTGSTGIALLGTYGSSAPSRAAEDALTKLLAWRLDLAHVDPLALLTVLSGGNERYGSSVPVLLRTVSGHRDTGFTECPGNSLYARLNALAAAAAKLGGPKIFDPVVEASAEGPVRFRARLSAALPWTVTVTSDGNEVARATGTGKSLDWVWDASSSPPAKYRWMISAGGARPATGSVQAGLGTTEVALAEVAAIPDAITPNGDGQGDTAELSYSLSTAANVTVELSDAAGTVLGALQDRVWTTAGKHTLTLDGAALADGSYTIVIRARTESSSEVVQTAALLVSRTLGLVSASPSLFSPNGDGRRDRLDVHFALAAAATVTVRIVREGRWVATPLLDASLGAGAQHVSWEGERSEGRLRDGAYEALVEVTDAVGTVSFGVPFTSDTAAPRIKILPTPKLRVSVSEPAVLKVWVNGHVLRREVRRAGIVVIRWPKPVLRVRIVAWDAAGNTGGAFARRQSRPAR